MSASIPQVFGGQEFPSKSALKKYLTKHVHNMPTHQPLDGFDLGVAYNVLELHHSGAEKIGCGVASVELRINAFRDREFWLRRTDGTEIDFTWAKVMDGPSSERANVMGALREAIRPQIRAFRRDFFRDNESPRCAITGGRLSDDKTTHIDHHDPFFVEIADGFIEASGGLETIKWGEPRDTTSLANMTDEDQIAEWVAYHRDRAVLRATTSEANLTRPRVRLDDAA